MGQSAAPDFKGAAEATAKSDQEALDYQTRANRMNQYNPWGSVEYSDMGNGQWEQRTNLTPQAQAALDAQMKLQQGRSELAGGMFDRIGEEFGQPMDWNQFGDQTQLEFDPTQMRQRAEDAAYGRATSRLDPRFEQDAEKLKVDLRNRGLVEGDAAYDSAMGNFERSKEDAYSNAQNQSILQGQGESQQLFGQQKQMADYANQLRQNQINEETGRRQFSLNEANALLSGQQVNAPQFQGYNQAGRAQGVDYSGAMQAGSDFSQAQDQMLYGGISDALGAGMGMASMFSDRRLKRNIKRIGEYLGYPFYSYEYVWGQPSVGVMSDEINQDAVSVHSSGFDVVDYDKIERMRA